MNELILALIYDYSIHQRFADEEFHKTIFELLKQENNLSQHVNDLKITKDRFAAYSYITKNITMCIETLKSYTKKYHFLFNNFEFYFFHNVLATKILLHEFEHANQGRKACETSDKNSIENDILRFYMSHENIGKYLPLKKYENQDKLKENNSLETIFKIKAWLKAQKISCLISYKTEEFEVCERLANVISCQQSLDLIQPIKNEIPNVIDCAENVLLKFKLLGYKYSLEPTMLFLRAISKSYEWHHLPLNEMDFKERLANLQRCYSLDERMKYGIAIDNDEYQSCLKLAQSNPKYNIYKNII